MKKWYAITAILAVLLIISIGTCAIGSGEDDRCREDLADAEQELDTVKQELNSVKSELAQLKATKQIDFGNGLRVFEIEKGYYEVRGKVQNTSDTPIDKAVVIVAFYNADGTLDEDWGSVDQATVTNLFPQEIAEWKVHFGNWSDQELGLFDVYAIGNRSTETQ